MKIIFFKRIELAILLVIGLLRTTADPESGRLRKGESLQLCDPFVETAW